MSLVPRLVKRSITPDYPILLANSEIASQARIFRAVAELTARESHEEEELLPELLQREKSLGFRERHSDGTPDPVS